MKNKTKITCVPDNSHAKPFNIIVACGQCGQQKTKTVYPALGTNFFECSNCAFTNTVNANEMEVCND
jgi:hypothetical protein